jgi:hypothetical protein
MPPLVDPVLPPENIIINISIVPAAGQNKKSTEANPVQVKMDMIWKKPFLNAVSKFIECGSRIRVAIEPAVTATTI